MKYLILISIVFQSLTLLGQLDPETKSKMDSLTNAIELANHDTTIIELRKGLSKILRKTNFDLEISNQKEIILIASKRINDRELSDHFRYELAIAYMNLGVTYKMKGVSDSALLVYEKSEKHFGVLNDTTGLMRVYGNTGNAYLNLNKLDRAIEYFEKCLEQAILLDNTRAIGYTYTGLGVIYKEQGDFNNAIDYYYKALELADEIGDTTGITAANTNIALIHKLMGNYHESIKRYLANVELYKRRGNKPGLALIYNNLGNVYENQLKTDSSLYYYELSLEIRKKLNDLKGIAGCYSNMANAYGQKKEYDKSESLLYKSLEIRRSIGDKKGECIALNNLASLYIKQNNFGQAINTVLESQRIGRGLLTQAERSTQMYILYEAYKHMGKDKMALENYESYIAIRDSISDDENQKQVIRQEYKYQYEKQAAADSVKAAEAAKVKDAQLSAEKAENKRHQIEAQQQRQQKYFLYGGLSLALLFGGFIFNRFRVTRRQKEVIEDQKQKVDVAYEQLGEKNQEILDSINYAKRIQSAILPPQKLVKEYFEDSFILYKPKDIVAGDFYWMEPQKDGVIFAAADCTGHGVPGAMVSVVCNNGLNRSVREHGLTQPAKILDKTREIIISEFEKSEEEVKDGMDIALVSLKKSAQREFERERDASTPLSARTHTQNSSSLCYSGAHNPLWIICSKERHPEIIHSLSKGGEGESGQTDKKQFSVFEDPESDHVLIEIKADKQPIGKFGAEKPFTNHTVELQKGDSIYIFSDGYADQFGGEKGKKFKSKNFKKLLLSVQNETMERQRQLLDEAFEEWKGEIEQLDDVCVIGVEV